MSEFDAFAGDYEDQVDSAVAFSGKGAAFFNEVKARQLIKLAATAGERILDAGCGTGMTHPLLTAHGLKVTGIDVSSKLLERAASANPACSYQHFDGGDFPFGDASFDVTYATCVLHHVPPDQWQHFVAEMHRVTRPGGLVAIFEHNPANPLTRRVVANCPMDANAVLLSRSQAVALLRAAGCEPVTGGFLLFTPFAGPFFRWLDRILATIPLGAQYWVAGRKPAIA